MSERVREKTSFAGKTTTTRIARFGLTVANAVLLTAGVGGSPANAINIAAAPSETALMALEASAYQAWQAHDAKFWNAFLSDKFVGWGSLGRLHKASASREYTGRDCQIKHFVLSDPHVSALDKDAALLTYQVKVEGTCDGEDVPASRAAGIYVREGGKWKAVFHAQAAIVDPHSPAVNGAAQGAARVADGAASIAQDARTDALLANERAVWEAWKDHDAMRIGALTAASISFINIFGTYLATKPEALKNWSGAGCDAKSVSVTDAEATMLSPTIGILTFKASADATCFGQKVGPVWGSSVYIKQGDAWKWRFGINVPDLR